MNTYFDQGVGTRGPVVAAWSTSGHDAPVFVDDTGRRAHGVRLAGAAIAILCACWLATLVLGMSGLTSLPGVHGLALARALPAQGTIAGIEPKLGGALQWADDTEGANRGRTLDLAYGGGVRE